MQPTLNPDTHCTSCGEPLSEYSHCAFCPRLQRLNNMKEPETLDEAAEALAETFRLITKPEAKPKVTLVGRDDKGRVVVAVGFRGDKLIQAMQVEAFIVENGDSIRFRSQIKDGNTIMVYQMEKKR